MKYEYKQIDKFHFIEMDNERNLKVYINRNGATIAAILYKGQLMTMTPINVREFFKPGVYYGKTIGPIANRVKEGKVDIEGKTYILAPNEGVNALHGGKNGISRAEFSVANFYNKNGYLSVILRYTSKKGYSDLPGNIIYEIAFTMNDKNDDFDVSLNAMNENYDCPFSLTNHTFFTLGERDVKDLTLTIPSHRFIETGKDDLLPLEEKDIIPCLDFNKGKLIGKDIHDPYLQNHKTKGYDHCFILDKKEIILEGSTYKLTVTTDFPAVHIYSDNYSDGVKMRNTTLATHRGLAIEPEDNLLNRKNTYKRSLYSRNIKYVFEEK